MLSVTAVIAVAVGCSVLLIVGATVGIVVWWRLRQDRLSLAMAQAKFAAGVPTGFNTVMADSRKDLSLPTYGQLPYGIPREWAPLGSQETFQVPMPQPKPPSPRDQKERSRSIRRSISKSLSKRLSLSKNNQKPVPLSPLITSSEFIDRTSANLPDVKEKEPTSAVEGFSELPAEITPRHTPERDSEEGGMQANLATNGPVSTTWPLLAQDRFSSDQRALLGERSTRVRGGSITTQTAGAAPEIPIPPPPPFTYTRGPYQFPQDDSLIRLSSLSLETANSSILDDGMRASMSVDGSPALPPCPTFNPFSPYDIVIGGSVARDCASQRRSQSQRLSSSTARLTFASSDSYRDDLGGTPPRRSLTARESPQPSEFVSHLPRRSESLLSPSGSRSSLARANGRPISSASFSSRHSASSSQGHLSRLPSHRQQRYSMYETRPAKEDQTQVVPGISRTADDRSRTIQTQSPGHIKGSPRAPLQSAMKSAHSMRKGHRRQNCVRISIHPPITFGGPAFSPMIEEPEEMSELEDDLTGASSQQQQWRTHTSPGSTLGLESYRRHGRHRSTGSLQEKGSALGSSPGSNTRLPRSAGSNGSNVSRKRSHSRMGSADDVFISENQTDLPTRLFSPPPPSEGHSLSRTPSPEKREPLWSLPPSDGFSGSSPQLPPNASTGSPRRSAVRGPRSIPTKQVRNSAPPAAITTVSSGNASPVAAPKAKRPVTHLAPASNGKDVRKSITLLRRMNSDAWDDESKEYRRMGSPSSMSLKSNRNSARLSTGSVTIWEDGEDDPAPKRAPRRSKIFSVLERIDSEGVVENVNNSTSYSGGGNSDSNGMGGSASGNDSSDSSESNSNEGNKSKSAPVLATPNNKTKGMGLGFGLSGGATCSGTPASLYDRDGFLKE
jgi:hypothetical protein